MAKLIRLDKGNGRYALARKGGKLVTDAGGAPCCCGGGQTWCATTAALGCNGFAIYGRKFRMTMEVLELEALGSRRVVGQTAYLEYIDANPIALGEASADFECITINGENFLSLAGVVSNTPTTIEYRLSPFFGVPYLRSSTNTVNGILDLLGFTSADFNNGWPIQPGIRSDRPYGTGADTLQALFVPGTRASLPSSDRQVGSGVDRNSFSMGIATATDDQGEWICSGDINPCNQAGGAWAFFMEREGEAVSVHSPSCPDITTITGQATRRTAAVIGTDPLSWEVFHFSRYNQTDLGTNQRKVGESRFRARYTIETLTPCFGGRSAPLPPHLDEFGRPKKQPGQCAGCGD